MTDLVKIKYGNAEMVRQMLRLRAFLDYPTDNESEEKEKMQKEKSKGEKLEEEVKQATLYFALMQQSFLKRVCKQIRKIKDGKKLNAYSSVYLKNEVDKEMKKVKNEYEKNLILFLAMLVKEYKKLYLDWFNSKSELFKYRNIDLNQALKRTNAIMQRQIEEITKDLAKKLSFNNLSVLTTTNKAITPSKAFEDILNKALDVRLNGSLDFDDEMANEIITIADSGLRVDFGASVTQTIETVAEKTSFFDIKQAHEEVEQQLSTMLECDGIEIDVHDNPRPSHEFMQGQQYSKTTPKVVNGVLYKSAIDEGIYDRLYVDYNCKHFETDIILGVSEPKYSTEQLEEIRKRNADKHKLGNHSHTRYEWSQVINELKRNIKKQETRQKAFSYTNDVKRVNKCRELVQKYQDKIKVIERILNDGKLD